MTALLRTLRPLALGCALVFGPHAHAQSAPAAPYKVVVNATNQASQLSRDQISRLFLKKHTMWSDGTTVLLVDQAESSPVRRAFTAAVHRREVMSVKRYWQQMIFSGRAVPPPERRSDAAVLEFVRMHDTAIGYVSANAPLDDRVKVVEITP
jgi:ABC-type phosphate transport system substrate-binding protein